MSFAVIWTGLMMSTPASMRSGSSLWIEPQEWRNVLSVVCSCTYALSAAWRGLKNVR